MRADANVSGYGIALLCCAVDSEQTHRQSAAALPQGADCVRVGPGLWGLCVFWKGVRWIEAEEDELRYKLLKGVSVIEGARRTANMHDIMLVHAYVYACPSAGESIGTRKVTRGCDKHIRYNAICHRGNVDLKKYISKTNKPKKMIYDLCPGHGISVVQVYRTASSLYSTSFGFLLLCDWKNGKSKTKMNKKHVFVHFWLQLMVLLILFLCFVCVCLCGCVWECIVLSSKLRQPRLRHYRD